VLKAVLARYAARGLTPVVATELEFYLYRLDQGVPVPPDGNMAPQRHAFDQRAHRPCRAVRPDHGGGPRHGHPG
jgi:glutamine synthetase